MTKNTKAVDYALPASLTVRDAEREWKAAARSYVAGLKGDESRTVSAILATRTALKAGLIVAGSVQGKNLPDGAISRTKFAAQFCAPVATPDGKAERGSQVTTTLVTFWERAAHCVDLGIVPGHPLWAIIVGRKAGRRNSDPVKVGDRIMAAKTIKAVETALQADGWDLKTGVRKTGPKAAKAAKQTDEAVTTDAPEADKPVAPFDSAKAAVAALDVAAKSLTDEEWEAIGRSLAKVVRREGTLRREKVAKAADAAKAAA